LPLSHLLEWQLAFSSTLINRYLFLSLHLSQQSMREKASSPLVALAKSYVPIAMNIATNKQLIAVFMDCPPILDVLRSDGSCRKCTITCNKKKAMERLTKQRKAILECLTATSCPLSVEDIMNEVVKVVPSINLSTLYRNLKILAQQREVELHEVAGQPPRYLIAKAEHVHHFLCQSCNRLFMIHVCPKEIASMVPAGFVMKGHSITLTGLCRECEALSAQG
jgi:Fur family transcriptional regulator, ferric uptake regulator